MSDSVTLEDRNSAQGSQSRDHGFIAFDDYQIDLARRRLLRGGRPIRIQRKPLDVLIHLARNSDRLVTREELLEAYWDTRSHEEALTRCVSVVRKLLDDPHDSPRYIDTIWGQGYRFIAEADMDESVSSAPGTSSATPSQDRFGGEHRWRYALLAAAALIAVLAWRFANNGPPETPTTVQRLAVIPVAHQNPDDEWMASALTNHLTDTLSRIEGLSVIARGSTILLTDLSDPVQLGQALGVDALVLSQLERKDKYVGMRAQLVSAADGQVLWSFNVEPVAEMLNPDTINQITASVTRRMWAGIQADTAPSTNNAAAYRLYLRGRYFWNQRTGTALENAIEAFDAALALDPRYVDALVGKAESWLLLPLYGAMPPNQAIPRAKEAALEALRLDGQSAHAVAVLGVIAMQYDWDWDRAEANLRQAVTLNPNNATAEQWLGELYCYRHRFSECSQRMEIARGLDPISPVLQMMRGSPALFSGDYHVAIREYEAVLNEALGLPFARYALGLARAGLGDWQGAIDDYKAALPHFGLEIVGGPLIYATARNGETGEAMALLSELKELSESRYVPPTKLAIAWLGTGDRDRAMQALDHAIELHDDRLVYLAVDVHFRELHDDPQFRERAKRLHLVDLLD